MTALDMAATAIACNASRTAQAVFGEGRVAIFQRKASSKGWSLHATLPADDLCITQLCWAPAEFGRVIAGGTADGSVVVWQETPGEQGSWRLVAALKEATLAVLDVAFAPPPLGPLLAVAYADGFVRWEQVVCWRYLAQMALSSSGRLPSWESRLHLAQLLLSVSWPPLQALRGIQRAGTSQLGATKPLSDRHRQRRGHRTRLATAFAKPAAAATGWHGDGRGTNLVVSAAADAVAAGGHAWQPTGVRIGHSRLQNNILTSFAYNPELNYPGCCTCRTGLRRTAGGRCGMGAGDGPALRRRGGGSGRHSAALGAVGHSGRSAVASAGAPAACDTRLAGGVEPAGQLAGGIY